MRSGKWPKGTIGMVVLCGSIVAVVLVFILYRTGWTSWRWEPHRGALPEDACAYIGRAHLQELVPGAPQEGESRHSIGSGALVCSAASTPGSWLRVSINRQMPSSGATPAVERARFFGEATCGRMVGERFHVELGELAERSRGSASKDGRAIRVELAGVSGPDTFHILYTEDGAGKGSLEERTADVTELAEDILIKLSEPDEE